MSVMSLREDCLDQTTEVALSVIYAADVMQSLYKNFKPSDLNSDFPPLFNELWEIHSECGRDIIPQTLAAFQQPDYQLPEIPEDM